ncbi:MAG TPA: hypothetical protein VIH18_27855 [Candidatus Binatia bacterium]|jgi:hypothetical protein
MKVNYFEKELSLTGMLSRDSMNGLAELVKGLFTSTQIHEDKASYWQLIWLQSEANGCFYDGDDLPYNIWAWPKNTWFQERLSHHLTVGEIAAHKVKN